MLVLVVLRSLLASLMSRRDLGQSLGGESSLGKEVDGNNLVLELFGVHSRSNLTSMHVLAMSKAEGR